uniref:DUF2783 domain-containing protein n=1 Tax=Stappia sp. TaxID=1870903 RepID=UPI003BAD8284
MSQTTPDSLTLSPNIPDPDGFYAELLGLHEGLSREESEALNARLVLVLANHVGDREILRAALAAAKEVTPTG